MEPRLYLEQYLSFGNRLHGCIAIAAVEPDHVASHGPDADRERSRRRTISVVNQGQTDGNNDNSTSSISALDVATPTQQMTALSNNTTTRPPTTAPADHSADHLSPGFLPKFNESQSHLRAFSTEHDEGASVKTGGSTVLPDDASTTAILNAPGVIKQTETPGNTASPVTDQAISDPRALSRVEDATTAVNANTHLIQDHVADGYDTPASRRSLERLLSHQTSQELVVNSNQMNGVASLSTLHHLRSPSTIAIVKSEGIADVVAGGSHDETIKDHDQRGFPRPKPALTDSDQASSQRPGLYDRGDSEFKTAVEDL